MRSHLRRNRKGRKYITAWAFSTAFLFSPSKIELHPLAPFNQAQCQKSMGDTLPAARPLRTWQLLWVDPTFWRMDSYPSILATLPSICMWLSWVTTEHELLWAGQRRSHTVHSGTAMIQGIAVKTAVYPMTRGSKPFLISREARYRRQTQKPTVVSAVLHISTPGCTQLVLHIPASHLTSHVQNPGSRDWKKSSLFFVCLFVFKEKGKGREAHIQLFTREKKGLSWRQSAGIFRIQDCNLTSLLILHFSLQSSGILKLH